MKLMVENQYEAKRTASRQGRLTICQVLHSLNVGGAEKLAYRLAQGLGERYRFVFACLDDIGSLGKELRRQGVTIELLGRRPGLDLRCGGRLGAFVRREKVDLLHAHQYTPCAYSLLAGLVRRRPPVLFNEHGRFHPDHRSLKRVLFNRLMLGDRDRVVAVGNSVRQALIDNEGISPSKIDVIYNGIELPGRAQDARVRAAVRAELGLAEDGFAIMHVARLDAIKDHATAVRTIARVASKQPNVRLFIVGDGPERMNIEQEIQRQRMGNWIRMLGERQDVGRLLAGADAFLLTSVSEGIPVTLIEAMGAGLPVVSTDAGGVREVVEAGSTGFLAPVGDDDALAKCLSQLMGDEQNRHVMGQAGRERAEAIFREDSMHAAYSDLYEDMVKAS